MPRSLSSKQQQIVRDLVETLKDVPGFQGAVLGGSYARGLARADSDIDLGVYYSDASPLCVQEIREVTTRIPDAGKPIVSELFEWGPWVNGGAWLTIQGQRVDLIYRSLEHLDRVIPTGRNPPGSCHFGGYQTSKTRLSVLSAGLDQEVIQTHRMSPLRAVPRQLQRLVRRLLDWRSLVPLG